MKNREIVKLSDVCEIILGQSPPSSTYNEKAIGLPFFQGKAEFGTRYPTAVKWCSKPKKIAKKNDVLISVRAPVGPTNIAPSQCCIGRGLAAIRSLKGIDYLYIFYYLRSIEGEFSKMGTGTTFKAIAGSDLRAISIPLAPLNEQKRIVAEIEKQFSRLDEAVAALKRIKANLKRYKASVLKAAVEGKLTEEWRKEHLPAPSSRPDKFYTYAILCEDDSIYIGHTDDIARRWKEHLNGQGSEWTRKHKPVRIAHYEKYDTRKEAADREKWLKTGYGRKWLKRELAAGRTRQAGDIEPASELLKRILAERRKKWEEAELAKMKAKGKEPKDDMWKKKYKETTIPDTSELPELPKGWAWASVGKLSEIIHYGYTASSTNQPIGPKMLRITDIQNNSVDWNKVPYCKIEKDEKTKYLLKDGDLVFARTGATVGKSFLVCGHIPESVFASYLIRIILSDYVDKNYIYSFFRSQAYWIQIHKGKLGIGQPNVNAQTLSQIVLPLPPLLEQQIIVEEIEGRLTVIDTIEKELEINLTRAERLRQSILKKAFSGKLVPHEAEEAGVV